MAISFLCDTCGRKYRVEDHLAGRQVKCRQCGTSMTVPGTPPPGAAAPTARATPPPPPVVAAAVVPPPPVWTPPVAPAAGYAPAPQAAWTPPSARGTVYRPPPVNAAPEKRRHGWKLWAPLGVGAVLVLGLGVWLAVRVVQKVASVASGAAGGITTVKVADFPSRPPMRELEPGVMFCDIKHGDTSRAGLRLWLYLPSTSSGQANHPPRSLPCVLVAPAGSNLITGMHLTDGPEGDQPEHLPYVKAGFAVVAYELDGHKPGGLEDAPDRDVVRAIKQFMAADGGVANGKAALEYVLAKVPEVDPNQVYAAGHSSAGTVTLLMAVHEPRLKGAIAYAPCTDVERHLGSDTLREIGSEVKGVADFARRTSPLKLPPPKCPVFVFHAKDDSMVPSDDSQAYVRKMQLSGDVSLTLVNEGEHHESMIEEGIPKGIQWLRRHGARPVAASARPAPFIGGAPNQSMAPPNRPMPPVPGPMRISPPGVPPMPPPPGPPPAPQAPPNQPPAEELGAVSPDPAMLAELGDEESVGAYKIRVPRGWRGAGAGPTRIWRGEPGQGRMSRLTLSVTPGPPNRSVRKTLGSNPGRLAGGELAYCTINGREFARIVQEHAAMGTIQYVAYDGDKEITLRLMYDPRDPKARDLLEAAVRTMR